MPLIERIRGLNIVVAIEQHMRHPVRNSVAVVRDDHGMAGCRMNLG